MRVSVVIPTFDSGPFVVEAVRSALAQTCPPHEVIVVDDGSGDDTAKRLAAFGSAIRYVWQANTGPAVARTRGVRLAAGDVIGFLDADDVWHPRKLECQLAAMASRPDLGMIGAAVYNWPAPCHPALPDCVGSVVDVPFDRLVVRNCFVTSSVLVRTEIIRAAGEFDRCLRGPEDYDMWLRVARLSPVANLDLRLAGYRMTTGSLSKNADRMEAGMRSILRKLEAGGVFRGRPLLRRRAWGYFHCSCGYMHHQAGNRPSAVRHLALSLVGYPFPYTGSDIRYPFGRVKLLAAALRSGRRPNPIEEPGRTAASNGTTHEPAPISTQAAGPGSERR